MKKPGLFFLAAMAVDRITKHFAVAFSMDYHKNYGIAFSLFQGSGNMAIAVGFFIIVLFVFFYRVFLPKISKFWLAILAAGAVGNMIDRVMFGYVIDWIFIGLYINIADILLIAGALGLLIELHKNSP